MSVGSVPVSVPVTVSVSVSVSVPVSVPVSATVSATATVSDRAYRGTRATPPRGGAPLARSRNDQYTCLVPASSESPEP